MTIIQVTASELASVVPLFDNYRVFYGQPSDLDLARSFLSARLANAESVILLAKDDDDKPIGFTQLYPSFSSVSAARTWVLNDLYVLEEYRGQGIGRQLLNAARDHAVSTKAKGISLQTARDNTNAQQLYESVGYVMDTEYFNYFLDL
ncbi:GNAT family N-acetyltransferase [Psychrobacter pygoscelis]|uniref:GNAT family N-acetyltransferase n=1 Tax=Psychrobacter pygoscelis TaxID=2488563 RepID=UPI00103FF9AD|nr:GNAT family N-acetyltransferase [Psychrobacter pygoscelis]